jgi:hypothetical protein
MTLSLTLTPAEQQNCVRFYALMLPLNAMHSCSDAHVPVQPEE